MTGLFALMGRTATRANQKTILSFVKRAKFICFCRRLTFRLRSEAHFQNGRFGRSPGSDAHGFKQLQARAAQAAVPNFSVAAAPPVVDIQSILV